MQFAEVGSRSLYDDFVNQLCPDLSPTSVDETFLNRGAEVENWKLREFRARRWAGVCLTAGNAPANPGGGLWCKMVLI